jgi:FAD:protein FMN transferase
MEYDAFRAMNTDIVMAAEGHTDAVQQGFAAAQRFIAASEARLTRFTDSSELAHLNASTGQPFQASPELFDVVRQARGFAADTCGLFDPAILNALEAAGYDRSMDDIRTNGAGPLRGVTAPASTWRDIHLDERTATILLPAGMRLDLGGIAKGWIAERAAHILADFTTACAVNAGGDMFASGVPRGELAWQVALEDPRNPERTLAILRLGPGALATSSTTRRRWQQDGQWQHHLIDPRRGAPAQTDWLSVTAIAAHATEAEVFAKALLIAGSKEAPALAAGFSDLAFIAVDGDGRLWGSANAGQYMDGGQ